MTNRPHFDLTGFEPERMHGAVLGAYRENLRWGRHRRVFGPLMRWMPESPRDAGQRRILERHHPAVLDVDAGFRLVWCARCNHNPRQGGDVVPWPCQDFTDAAAGLPITGLFPAEPV